MAGMHGSTESRNVLVDTNVVSYLFKDDTRAQAYLPHLLGRQAIISFMTVAELDFWADLNDWGVRRRRQLEEFLSGYQVYYADRAVCSLWSAATLAARRAGRPILASDAWIAATALVCDPPLITYNPSDFAGVPALMVISEHGSMK